MNRRELIGGALSALALPGPRSLAQSPRNRPNILWIIAEDNGPEWGCYGFPYVNTPNVNGLAAQGVRFTRAFTTAPVCSASRSAFNTGMYQTTIGAHHHRSHRKDGYVLPEGVRTICDRMREAGYFTANVTKGIAPGVVGTGKTDWNFNVDEKFDGTHWNQRKRGQPFYAQINFQATHKGPAFPEARRQKELVDPDRIQLPPYWPDHPTVRDEYANYLDCVNLLDGKVGVALDKLNDEELEENTVVFFFGDNGRCLIRGKQWLYDAGIRVPLIVRWPGGLLPGSVREDPVSAIDITATSLWLAGVEPPKSMQGQVMFDAKGNPANERNFIFAARDRCDMTEDRIRCVRTRNYKYIRNFHPERPYTQHNEYIESQYPTLGAMKKLHEEGALKGFETVFMQERKPEEELYDVLADPNEVRNLASSPPHQQIRKELSARLDGWLKESNDQGRSEEKIDAKRGSGYH